MFRASAGIMRRVPYLFPNTASSSHVGCPGTISCPDVNVTLTRPWGG